MSYEDRLRVSACLASVGAEADAALAAKNAEIARLRDALEELCIYADESDSAKYGTLATRFVRDIARAALANGGG